MLKYGSPSVKTFHAAGPPFPFSPPRLQKTKKPGSRITDLRAYPAAQLLTAYGSLLLFRHLPRGLGTARGAEDIYLFGVADELFLHLLRRDKAYIPAGARGALGMNHNSLLCHAASLTGQDEFQLAPRRAVAAGIVLLVITPWAKGKRPPQILTPPLGYRPRIILPKGEGFFSLPLDGEGWRPIFCKIPVGHDTSERKARGAVPMAALG
jgi:hypothetical protein